MTLQLVRITQMLALRRRGDTSTVAAIHKRKDTRRVLTWVNAKRAELGMQPIASLPTVTEEKSGLASIADALSNKYTDVRAANRRVLDVKRYSRLSDNSRGSVVQKERYVLPKYAMDWVRKFDRGEFPAMVRS